MEPPELAHLMADGSIVRHLWHRHDSGALLLRIAAGDADRVHAVLDPVLPRRTWIVPSRYTVQTVRRLERGFDRHHRVWGFQVSSTTNLTADGQPTAYAEFPHVTQDLADWADTFPPGLLRLDPTMTPAPGRPAPDVRST